VRDAVPDAAAVETEGRSATRLRRADPPVVDERRIRQVWPTARGPMFARIRRHRPRSRSGSRRSRAASERGCGIGPGDGTGGWGPGASVRPLPPRAEQVTAPRHMEMTTGAGRNIPGGGRGLGPVHRQAIANRSCGQATLRVHGRGTEHGQNMAPDAGRLRRHRLSQPVSRRRGCAGPNAGAGGRGRGNNPMTADPREQAGSGHQRIDWPGVVATSRLPATSPSPSPLRADRVTKNTDRTGNGHSCRDRYEAPRSARR